MSESTRKIVEEIVEDIKTKISFIAPNAVLNTKKIETLSIEYGELESHMALYFVEENKIIVDERYVNDQFRHMLTHELIHILSTNNSKTGVDHQGMTAINEGITECLTVAIMGEKNNIVSYFDTTFFSFFLGKMIGFDKMVENYFNNDVIGLLTEFRKVMKNDEKVLEIINLLNETFTTDIYSKNSKLTQIVGKTLYQFLENNEYNGETIETFEMLIDDMSRISQSFDESYKDINKLRYVLDLYKPESINEKEARVM